MGSYRFQTEAAFFGVINTIIVITVDIDSYFFCLGPSGSRCRFHMDENRHKRTDKKYRIIFVTNCHTINSS